MGILNFSFPKKNFKNVFGQLLYMYNLKISKMFKAMKIFLFK